MKYDERELCSFAAFLYAGALQCPRNREAMREDNINLFDDWDGHTGFVWACAEYAEHIQAWLQLNMEIYDTWPGVLEYEILEPLGEWLLTAHEYPPEAVAVLDEFKARFIPWVTGA